MTKIKPVWLKILIAAGFVILFDQLSKSMAQGEGFTLVYNTGVSFGLGDSNIVSLIISVVALLIISILGREWWRKYWFIYALILGGGVSNIFDRLWWGAVIDWLPVWGKIQNNLADVAINVGVIWLFVVIFRSKSSKSNQESSKKKS